MSDLVKTSVGLPPDLLKALPQIKSANPKVQTAADHLKEAVRMYMLLHQVHIDGKRFVIRDQDGGEESLKMFF